MQIYPDILGTDAVSDSRQMILDRENSIKSSFSGPQAPVVKPEDVGCIWFCTADSNFYGLYSIDEDGSNPVWQKLVTPTKLSSLDLGTPTTETLYIDLDGKPCEFKKDIFVFVEHTVLPLENYELTNGGSRITFTKPIPAGLKLEVRWFVQEVVGRDGATFVPSIVNNVLTWDNNQGLPNPSDLDFNASLKDIEDFANEQIEVMEGKVVEAEESAEKARVYAYGSVLTYDEKCTYTLGQYTISEKDGEISLFKSLVDNNVGNDLSDENYWKETKLGSGEWGDITGDITKQEDLQQALNNAGTPDDLSIKKENNILKAVGLLDQNDTSKAISVWGGSREQYNEIEHKNENTLYHTTDDSGESVDVTREIELNNPFSLLDYKWSEYEITNASWLISNGVFHSGATYVAVYELLLKLHNGTETKDGVSVKLSTEEYTDTDFVINTADSTFRLPVKVKLASGNAVVGNGMTLGLTNGTNNYGLTIGSSSNGDLHGWGSAYGQNVNTSATFSGDSSAGFIGITTDPTKSGIETSSQDLKLYFYVGETIQDANIINASGVLTRVVELSNEYIVGLGIPDYSAGISLNISEESYTAPMDGIICLFVYFGESSHDKDITINGMFFGHIKAYSSGYYTGNGYSIIIPVSKGDIVAGLPTYTGDSPKRVFYPLKGVN